jgi:hypothetical protein
MIITLLCVIAFVVAFGTIKVLRFIGDCTTDIVEQIRRYFVETSKEMDRQRMDLGFVKELLTEIIEDHKKSSKPDSVAPTASPKKNPRKGRRMSDEHKQKIREAHLRRREENAIADWREESNKKAAESSQPLQGVNT